MQKFKILFIGLGRMGYPMAVHLSKKKNIDLYVYNRTKSKEVNWLKPLRVFLTDYQKIINLIL